VVMGERGYSSSCR